jgi:hypothetical protein
MFYCHEYVNICWLSVSLEHDSAWWRIFFKWIQSLNFSKCGRIYVHGYFPRNPRACRLMVAICRTRLLRFNLRRFAGLEELRRSQKASVIGRFRPRTEKSGNHCHHLYRRRRLTVNFFAGLCFGNRVLCGLAIARILTSAWQIVPISKRVYWSSCFGLTADIDILCSWPGAGICSASCVVICG